MAWRPDTRGIVGARIDSLVIIQSVEIFAADSPNEGGLCFAGRLEDTVITDHPVKILVLTGVSRATSDSADLRHVWFPSPRAGCGRGTVATGHSHPPGYPCDHSDQDAYLLFGNPRVLLSIVWCPSGDLNYLWQDGTRTHGRWRREP